MRNRLLALAVVLFSAGSLWAQTEGTYVGFSPYSVFGVGNLHQAGSTWNRGMGGVGIAARNNRFVNVLNPASVTARDTLSFMADISLGGRLSLFKEGDKQAYNAVFVPENLAISFPMWRNTAFMVGIRPVSDVGYSISYRELDPRAVQRQFTSTGNGGTYNVFAAAAITLWDRLSVGLQGNYVFGNINKKSSLTSSDESYLPMTQGDSLQINNLSAKIGLQYQQPLAPGSYLTVGATYQISTGMWGHSIHYRSLGSYDRKRSAAELKGKGLKMGDELGVGVNYRFEDKFMVEVDYTRSNWKNSHLDQVSGFSNVGDVVFAPGVGQSVRIGGEFTPNRNDIRYFLRRCTYRAGAYFEQSYYTVDGAHVNSVGITLGMTLPVFRWYNGLSVGLEAGRRGLATSQVKENYFGFSLGFNIFDIWFQKRAYQ
ncbi:MAG: hypothetical protein II824_04655 [Bacteroidales bacterium]|nr:hypothetical protein [Bacteroidales bacterium]